MAFRNKKIKLDIIREIGSGYSLSVDGESFIAYENGTLFFDGHDSLRIEIKSGKFVPDVDPQDLVGIQLKAVTAMKNGDLRVLFSDGKEFMINYCQSESWCIRNDRGLHVVSVAGGGISIWG